MVTKDIIVTTQFPNSSYVYSANTLIEDVEDIKKGQPPSFPIDSEDTYKRWEPYTQINAEVIPIGIKPKPQVALYEDKVETIFSEGNVQVLPKGEKTWVKVRKDMVLKRGDTIKTGSSSTCDISFDKEKKNVVGVLENSEIKITLKGNEKIETKEAEIYDRLSALSKKTSFEIKTTRTV